jgi:purine-binding chemotaxis protein CheW
VSSSPDLLERFFYRPDEAVPALFGADLALGEAPPPVVVEPQVDYLAFRLANERYAVKVESVREILKVTSLTEIPRGAPNLIGVMDLRGEITPVYDVKVRLQLAERAPRLAVPPSEREALPRSARVLVLGHVEAPAGVLVDEVYSVVRLTASSIEQPPSGVGGERDGIVGIGRADGELYVLLELAGALT